MKKSEEDRLKYAVNESTLSTAARSPFPNGEGYDTRSSLFSHCQSEYTHMWKNNNDGQSLPLKGKGLAWTLPPSYGRRCPEGAEVGWG